MRTPSNAAAVTLPYVGSLLPSSAVMPKRIGTSLTGAVGPFAGRHQPSATSPKRPPTRVPAAGNARSAASELSGKVLAHAAPACSASASDRYQSDEPPLIRMARWKSPAARGERISALTSVGARGLPGERHATGVTAEGRDVPPDPLQRGDAIEQPVVPGSVPRGLRAQPGMREEAECAQAVVDGHHHEAATGELGAVVHGHRAGSSGQRAAVQPHEHRALRAARSLRGPEVEVEAVLARPLLRDELRRPGRRGPWHLLAARSDAVGPAHAAPGRRRLRRLPPERPDRRPRVGHPPEDDGRRARRSGRLRSPRSRCAPRPPAPGTATTPPAPVREAGRRPELACQPPNEMMQMVSGDVGDHPARRPRFQMRAARAGSCVLPVGAPRFKDTCSPRARRRARSRPDAATIVAGQGIGAGDRGGVRRPIVPIRAREPASGRASRPAEPSSIL